METFYPNVKRLLLITLLSISPVYFPSVAKSQSVLTDTVNVKINTKELKQPEITKIQSQTQSQIFVRDEIYFGLSKPNGKIISELEWFLFLNRVISPRFPEGLTVVDANGHYQSHNGQIIREKTKLLILIHPQQEKHNQYIREIISTYKQMFQQESVLRITNPIQISF